MTVNPFLQNKEMPPSGYCPKCGSRLYPVDIEHIKKTGVCSYCIVFNKIPVKPNKDPYAKLRNRKKD